MTKLNTDTCEHCGGTPSGAALGGGHEPSCPAWSFQGYVMPDLEEAFRRVADPADWRGPVDYWVDEEDVSATKAAVLFYTATEAVEAGRCRVSGGWQVRLVAADYRAGPAGP